MKKKELKNTEKANKRVQNSLKKAKEDWIDNQCKEIDACLNKKKKKKKKKTVRKHISW